MTDREALFRAVRESPEDDAPKLVYADFLEENGEPDRAEFVRARVRLASVEEFGPEWDPLTDRCHELLDVHGESWRAELPPFDGVRYGPFLKGFVDSVSVADGPLLRRVAPRLFPAIPVRRLRIESLFDRSAAPVSRMPELAYVSELDLTPADTGRAALGSKGLETLAASPFLLGLRALSLEQLWLGTEGVHVLLGSPWERLRSLNLALNGLDEAAVSLLAGWDGLANVEELWLGNRVASETSLAAIGHSSYLSRLKWLELTVGSQPGWTLDGVLQSPLMSRLEGLRLRGAGTEREMMRFLRASPGFPSLRRLELMHANGIDELFPSLAATPFTALESLSLTGLRLPIMDALFEAPWLHRLRSLTLTRPLRVSIAELEMRVIGGIADCPALAGLRRLHLGGWGGGRDQITRLARSPYLRNLRCLRLTEHGLSDGGLAVLSDPSNFPELRSLDLQERELGSAEPPALDAVRARFRSRLTLTR